MSGMTGIRRSDVEQELWELNRDRHQITHEVIHEHGSVIETGTMDRNGTGSEGVR